VILQVCDLPRQFRHQNLGCEGSFNITVAIPNRLEAPIIKVRPVDGWTQARHCAPGKKMNGVNGSLMVLVKPAMPDALKQFARCMQRPRQNGREAPSANGKI
jgi:hypothetical protein